jgi:hypothetical protein
MYRGRRFSRDQLLFVVQTIFRGAADQIQSCLPPVISIGEAQKRHGDLMQYIQGVVNTVGIQLPILYAQLTDDGLGAGDFPQFGDFSKMVDTYFIAQMGLDGKFNKDGTFPNTDDLAEDFVDEFLTDYILGG